MPVPELDETGFEVETTYPGYQGNYWVTHQAGRILRDDLTMRPVLADGSSASSEATPRFCDCRKPDLTPISDSTLCADPNGATKCILSPRQATANYTEGGANAAGLELFVTAWHLVTNEIAQSPQKGAAYPASYPGASLTRRWLFEDDYDYWVNVMGWMSPAGAPGSFGPGTDLGGGLWFHDPVGKGAGDHGLNTFSCDPATEACSIADGFLFGVGPDERTSKTVGGTLLVDAPVFTLCPPNCPAFELDTLIYWPPVLTVVPDGSAVQLWGAESGLAPGGLVSDELQLLLANPDALVMPASGTALARSDSLLKSRLTGLTGALGEPSSPRALALRQNGGGDWELLAVVPTASGVFDLAVVEQLDSEHALVPMLDEPDERAHLVTAYSRSADRLWVLRNTPSGSPQIFTRDLPRPNLVPEGAWRIDEVGSMGQFGVAPEAAFSPKDWHLWVIDEAEPEAGYRLRRVQPSTGAVHSFKALAALEGASEAWVVAYDDGRIVLATNFPGDNEYALALLDVAAFASPEALTVVGRIVGEGQLLSRPQVARGVITVLAHPDLGDIELSPATHGYTSSMLEGSWTELQSDLLEPDLPIE